MGTETGNVPSSSEDMSALSRHLGHPRRFLNPPTPHQPHQHDFLTGSSSNLTPSQRACDADDSGIRENSSAGGSLGWDMSLVAKLQVFLSSLELLVVCA